MSHSFTFYCSCGFKTHDVVVADGEAEKHATNPNPNPNPNPGSAA